MPCMLSLQRIPRAACLSALLLGLAGPMSSDACFHHDLQGDKVKLTMQFKGREMEFQELGRQMFDVSSSPQQRNATALLIIQPCCNPCQCKTLLARPTLPQRLESALWDCSDLSATWGRRRQSRKTLLCKDTA